MTLKLEALAIKMAAMPVDGLSLEDLIEKFSAAMSDLDDDDADAVAARIREIKNHEVAAARAEAEAALDKYWRACEAERVATWPDQHDEYDNRRRTP
jgi:hypothetical protein